jgi:hypothetical protein
LLILNLHILYLIIYNVDLLKLFYKFNVLRNSRLRSSIVQNKIQDIGNIRPI